MGRGRVCKRRASEKVELRIGPGVESSPNGLSSLVFYSILRGAVSPCLLFRVSLPLPRIICLDMSRVALKVLVTGAAGQIGYFVSLREQKEMSSIR